MREEIALSSILGASVYDSTGAYAGQVREVAIFPQEDPNRISDFVVKTKEGDRLLPSRLVKTVIGSSIQVNGSALDWTPLSSSEGMLLLERDLLDQQIIDVSGRKVVRVNDVDLMREQQNGTLKLRVGRVDIGLRGANPASNLFMVHFRESPERRRIMADHQPGIPLLNICH